MLDWEQSLVKPDKRVLYGLVIIAGLMLFSNLGSQALWQDEGEVAILAKNILRTGLPVVDTGKQIFSILGGSEYNDAGIWTYHPWLSHYTAAASILIFGETTAGARMLFAIIGLLGFIASLKLLKKICTSNKEFYLAAFFLITNVSFFLYARQVRYYALNLFLTPLLLYFYLQLIEKPNKANTAILSGLAILLFYTNGITFFAITIPLALHFFWEKRKSALIRKHLVVSAITVIAFTIPWMIYAKPAIIGETFNISLFSKAQALFSYFAFYVNFTHPLVILLLLPLLLLAKGNEKEVFINRFVFILLSLPILLVALVPLNEIRYYIGLLPLLALYYAKLFNFFARAWKPLAVIFLILIAFTNVFSAAPFIVANNSRLVHGTLLNTCEKVVSNDFLFKLHPEWDKRERCELHIASMLDPEKTGLKFPFFYYVYELTHDYEGPVEVVSRYLNENGDRNDLIFTNYENGPLIFYTGMVAPYSSHYKELKEKPRWIIPRAAFPLEREYLIKKAQGYNATAITLPVAEQLEENYPNPYSHRYWTKKKGEPLVIYKVA